MIACLAAIVIFLGCEKASVPIDTGTEQESHMVLFDFVSLFVGFVVFYLIITGRSIFKPVNLAICGICYIGIGIRFIKNGYIICGITFILFSIYVFIKLWKTTKTDANNKEIDQ